MTAQGQVIGAVVADNQMIAQRAAKLVKIEYEDLTPVLITIEVRSPPSSDRIVFNPLLPQDAIREKSFFEGFSPRIVKNDVTRGFKESDHVLEGEVRMGGQDHFYLETNCTLVIPKGEDDELEIFCSTQNPAEIQVSCA